MTIMRGLMFFWPKDWITFNWNVKILFPQKMNLRNEWPFCFQASNRAIRLVLRLIDIITEFRRVANLIFILLLTFIAWLSMTLSKIKIIQCNSYSIGFPEFLSAYSCYAKFFVLNQSLKKPNITSEFKILETSRRK